MLWTVILERHPGIEPVILSMLASKEVVGWYGASIKLITVLLFPATILGGALMPTLVRLMATERDTYRRGVTEWVRVQLLIAAPVAAGTYVFAERGTRLVFGPSFSPSADILRVLSLY